MPVNNALHIASENGELDDVQSQIGQFDIDAKGERGETALLKASNNGYGDVVNELLTHNADVNIANVRTIKMICISDIPNH